MNEYYVITENNLTESNLDFSHIKKTSPYRYLKKSEKNTFNIL